MELVAATPGSIMTPINANTHAVQLLDEDNLILRRLQVASLLERISIGSDLEQQSAKMCREAVLTPLLDLRDGVSISAEQLSTLGKELNSMHHDERNPRLKVLMFEWVYFQVALRETQDLLLLVFVDGKLEHRKSLDMKLNDVEAWVDKELGDPAFRDRPLAVKSGIAALMHLEQLVEPILDLSDPDDTLVFCPTRERCIEYLSMRSPLVISCSLFAILSSTAKACLFYDSVMRLSWHQILQPHSTQQSSTLWNTPQASASIPLSTSMTSLPSSILTPPNVTISPNPSFANASGHPA